MPRFVRAAAVPSLALGFAVAGVAAEPQPLRPGQRLDRPLASGETHRYEVSLPEGYALEVRLTGQGAALTLSLEDQGGQELLRGSPLLLTALGSGQRLAVRAQRRDARASRYRLELAPARVATEPDALRVSAALALNAGRRQLDAQSRAADLAAEREFSESRRRYEAAQDVAGQAEALRGLGSALQRLGRAQAALEAYERARALAEAAGDPKLLCATSSDLGLFQSRLGQMPAAFANLHSGLRIARAQQDPALLAQALVALATAFAHTEQGDEALALLEEALPLAVDQGDVLRQASIHNTLGGIYVDLQDGERAQHHVRAALAIYRQTGQRQRVAGALSNLAVVLSDVQDRHAEALPHLDDALALVRADGNRAGEAGALDTRGAALFALGRHEEALASYAQAIAIWRERDDARGLASGFQHVGAVHLERGRAGPAREAFSSALGQARRAGRAQAELEALLGLAQSAVLEADPARALASVEECISLIESTRQRFTRSELRTTYFSLVRPAYELQVELLMRTQAVAAALRASERARARTLLDALAAADARDAPPLPAPPQAELAEIQRQLDAGTVLVEYLLGESTSYAWVVTRDALRGVALGGRHSLEAAARRVLELVTARNARGGAAAADRELPGALLAVSEKILTPLALPEAQRLVIVADGALQYLPFAALPLPESGVPLVASRQLVMLPSASVLPALRGSPEGWTRPGSVAVLADPVFRSDDPRVPGAVRPRPDAAAPAARSAADELRELPRLRFSRHEAETIGRLAAGRARLFLDFAASREALASDAVADAHVIHFATHGLLNSRSPERTGLVLSLLDARGAARDGFLRLPDLHRLRLKARLAVLSACQTALGKEVRGEGLVGLTRGFMLSGAPRVVASLWRVDDQGTAELMARFYRAMLERGHHPAAALVEAQRGLAADPRWRAPYYWAAFTFHGDWN
jgi:CHAT domain-containing protein/predicted negative regulator of RcsB-dependent stress response